MKPTDLRQLADDELDARVLELRNNLFNARIKHATSQLDSTAGMRGIRRDIARALTIRAERRERP